MSSERWERVRQVFDSALERAPAQRDAFLTAACAGDQELRYEVEALLASHQQADGFGDAPAREPAEKEKRTLRAGSRLGPYEVVALIGAGGMGEVYRARDLRLQREVALKVLPEHLCENPAMLERFKREATAAAALSHPNIMALYDVGRADGVDYAVAELLEGETLRSRLSRGALQWPKAAEIGVSIAQGLAAAHAKGIIHRDLKPDNVFLTRQGRVKLLDFGLAKLLQEPREDGQEGARRGPRPESTVMGTPGYIAPERLEGRPADYRADIFALGAILYRMLTGRPAFGAERTVEELRATLTHEPRSFSAHHEVPPALERIVRRCLAKRPDERYRSAREVSQALEALYAAEAGPRWRWALAGVAAVAALLGASIFLDVPRRAGRDRAAALRPIRSLAVLPLKNVSGDPDQEYLADGMTEALITEMARSDRLRVISRASVMALKETKAGRSDIARQLDVDAVVEGSVQRAGTQMRIAVELIRAATDERVWAGTYERDRRDVFALQHEVAGAISSEIALVANPAGEHPAPREPRSVEAYEAYLRGRYYWNLRSAEVAPKAIDQFNRALGLDPLYAQAYVGLADTYMMLGDMLYLMPHGDAFARAEAAAQRALDLDPSRAEAYASMGHLRMHAWRWAEAERAFQRALELDPDYASALQWRAYNLVSIGRMDEAVAAIERAQQIDPLSLIINADMAHILYFAGRHDQAIAQAAKTLQMNPAFAEARRVSFLALQRAHRAEEALADLESYRRLPDGGIGGSVGYGYAVLGRRAQALAVLHELEEESRRRLVPAYDFAVIHAGLGDAERALSWLDTSLADDDPESTILPVDPRLDSLRGDPRFAALLRRMGLPLS
jgi:eukaryotic-like serine/threonine-protein kinase